MTYSNLEGPVCDYKNLYSFLTSNLGGNWYDNESKFSVKNAHENAIDYMRLNFNTIQKPKMEKEKRLRYYPFGVKIS